MEPRTSETERLNVAKTNKNTKSTATSLIRNTNQRTGCLLVAWLLIDLISFASAALPGNLMASSDGETGNLVVYYLSPQVLTRTRMTPDRLRRDAFRLEDGNLPTAGMWALLKGVHSTEHEITGANASRYDFRLCISSKGESVWFNSDGKVGYTRGQSFVLSATEEADVLRLFGELDSLVYTRKKAR
jgi:hypothetical protein